MEAHTRTPIKRRAAFIFASVGFHVYLKYLNLDKKLITTALKPNLPSIWDYLTSMIKWWPLLGFYGAQSKNFHKS